MKKFIIAVAAFLGFGAMATLSAQSATFLSPDLFMEGLRGNVAKVEILWQGYVQSESHYNERGYLIPNEEQVIKRNEQGCIVTISTPEDSDWYYAENYTWNTDGYITGTTFENDDVSGSTKYYYDNNFDVVKIVSEAESDDYNITTIKEYTILARDNNGNWTKRRVRETQKLDGVVSSQTTDEHTRRITYR